MTFDLCRLKFQRSSSVQRRFNAFLLEKLINFLSMCIRSLNETHIESVIIKLCTYWLIRFQDAVRFLGFLSKLSIWWRSSGSDLSWHYFYSISVFQLSDGANCTIVGSWKHFANRKKALPRSQPTFMCWVSFTLNNLNVCLLDFSRS